MKMIDEETKKRIIDFFDGHELAEFLQLKTEEVLYYFHDVAEDALDDIEELMGVRHGHD
jgi:hypothetical protein